MNKYEVVYGAKLVKVEVSAWTHMEAVKKLGIDWRDVFEVRKV